MDKALRSLVERLASDSSTDKPNPDETALQALDREMDFELWWGRTGKEKGAYYDQKADSGVSSFVRRAVSGQPRTTPKDGTELQLAAKIMAGQLKGWRVEAVTAEDATDRPWLVFQCYFQLLSREHLGKPQVDKSQPPSDRLRFASRLPEKPLAPDGHFRNEGELINKLAALTNALNTPADSNQVEVLLEKVVKEMDYNAWLKDADSPKIKQFVDRFRK